MSWSDRLSQGSRVGSFVSALANLFYEPDGPITEMLARVPGAHGLGQVPAQREPNQLITSVCGFCATGCGLSIHLRDQQSINVSPAVEYPVNRGVACPKGWEALTVLDSSDRATHPLARHAGGTVTRLSWHDALTLFCDRMHDVQQRHGNDSVAFLSTGQMTTEEMALLGSVAKFGMGMRHGDGNTRQCMATAVTAYKQSFGFDAPPYTYRDLEESDVVVLVGSNLCIAHPILWERISRNPHSPKIIVVDPRRTETASAATHHLQIAPKTDLELFYSVAQLLIERDCIDRQYIEQHTTGFREFADLVRPYSVSRAATATGLQQEQIEQFAEMIHHGKRVSFWWTMGVNQSYQGVRTAQSLINLALLTGNIGRPGTGANSITGQCNAMGSRLFSNTTCLLGGRDFADPEDRLEVADILGIPESAIPEQSSWPYDTILSRIRTGDIRALWIIATNPAHSWIDQNEARDLLAKLDFLVVQDMYHNTETAQLADLVLPAAGWGEKTGTFINSERRIGLTQQACVAPGEALSDFSIFKLVAEYWGCGSMFDKWESPAAAFEILRELSRNQPCDFTGIADYQALCDLGGVQWPCREPAERACSERRLFEDGKFFHADGRACFVAEAPQAMPEVPCDKYPFLLLTGRGSVAQWHTQTRTSKSPVLRKLSPQQLYIEIHPVDAKRLGVHNGEAVHVASRRGSLVAKVSVTATVRPGQAFLPMHYEASNKLTLAHFDPYSRQPSYKDCAVNITPAISSGDQR